MTTDQVRDLVRNDTAASLAAMLERRATATPTAEAFLFPHAHVDGSEVWQRYTWAETREQVHLVAAALIEAGLQRSQRVAIASSTRIEWILADLGVACAGGATTTIYPNTTPDDVNYIMGDCQAVALIAENAAQLAKLTPEVGKQLSLVVLFDDDRGGDAADSVVPADQILGWGEFVERGRGYLAEHPDAVSSVVADLGHDDLSTLIYTSGTTGQPKGVELTHGNWAFQGAAVRAMDLVNADDLQYLWLPLSHVFGKALIAAQLDCGFASAVDGRLDRIVDGLGQIHPTFMCGAPRIFEKVRNAVMTSAPADGVKGRIARWAFAVGRESRGFRLAGRDLPGGLKVRYALADRLVFSKLKTRMGGRIRFFMSGSAKLSSQVQEWFYSAGITVVEGYGATETSAIAFVNRPDHPKFGTVGTASPGLDVRIADDGEVMLRGPIITRGYHGAAAKETANALDADGWYSTGDIGELDAEGYLRITDRKKDLIKTSGGKYVAPQKVEAAIAANCPLVSQSVAIGEGRKFVVALVTLDPQAVQTWASRHGHEGLSHEQLVALPDLRGAVQAGVDQANERLERWETVKTFAILPEEFSVDGGDVTPNMKIRRSVVMAHNSELVDSLYGPDS